jgi:Zn-dependent peptidase ImmA (M78 family)
MYWDKDFQNVVDPIARHLGVSSAAIKIKLLEMGKLNDPNKLDNKKII